MFIRKQNKTFYWEGIDRFGEKKSGWLITNNKNNLKLILNKKGIVARKITYQRSALPKINRHDILHLTRQLNIMFSAGISVIQAIELLANSQKKYSFLLQTIYEDLHNGSTFAEALKKHPQYFNDVFYYLVDSGEKSGTLEQTLNNIIIYQENLIKLQTIIKRACTYPAIVLVISGIVVLILCTLVIPQFITLFENFLTELPWFTRLIINAVQYGQFYWQYIIFVFILVSVSLVYIYYQYEAFTQNIAKFIFKLPVIRSIVTKSNNAKFFRTLNLTYSAGFPILTALKTAGQVSSNDIYKQEIAKIANLISMGYSLKHAFKSCKLFKPLVSDMIGIGEYTGNLTQILEKITLNYEQEVEQIINSLHHWLEPALMLVIGIIIGSLIIALYIPMFNLSTMIN